MYFINLGCKRLWADLVPSSISHSAPRTLLAINKTIIDLESSKANKNTYTELMGTFTGKNCAPSLFSICFDFVFVLLAINEKKKLFLEFQKALSEISPLSSQ